MLLFLNGAKRMIVMDVKGPGIVKNFKENLPGVTLKTPWNLGEVLYFNGSQAAFNMALGQLEMEKALHLAQGYWYTFSGKIKQKQYLFFQDFLKEKKQTVDKKNYQELSSIYGKKVNPYNIGLCLFEILGQYFQVTPAKKYNFSSFKKALKKQFLDSQQVNQIEEDFWHRRLLLPHLLFEKQQFQRLLEGKEAYTLHMESFTLVKEFLEYIVQNTPIEEEKINGSN